MTRRKEVRDWLKDDQEQMAWATAYLEGKSQPMPASVAYDWLVPAVERLSIEDRRRMREAWNTHVSKANGKRKTQSFTLPEEAIRKLKEMASAERSSPTKVIERLLLQLSQIQNDVKERQEKKQKPPESIDVLIQRQDSQIKGLKSLLKLRQDAEVVLLAEGARQRIALAAHGLVGKGGYVALTPDQEMKAEALQRRWMSARNKSIKERTKLASFLATGISFPTEVDTQT